ncbi:hypothetical protein KAR91_10545 [Candidatus Pacearchaeota archaeon]|nr:hypothetical protein [Candidatus Pacearchaeota archaeon]
MAIFQLENPSIQINNDNVMVKPNTAWYDDGLGEDSYMPVANGNNTEIIISKNLETKIGRMGFALASTAANAALFRTIKLQPGANVVKMTDPDSDFSRTLTSCGIPANVEIQIQNAGVLELEFHGNTLV